MLELLQGRKVRPTNRAVNETYDAECRDRDKTEKSESRDGDETEMSETETFKNAFVQDQNYNPAF